MHQDQQTKEEVEFGLQLSFAEGMASASATLWDGLLRRAQWTNFGHGGFVLTRDHTRISSQQENGTRVPDDYKANRLRTWRPG